mgnify:CR=1 FL=1
MGQDFLDILYDLHEDLIFPEIDLVSFNIENILWVENYDEKS